MIWFFLVKDFRHIKNKYFCKKYITPKDMFRKIYQNLIQKRLTHAKKRELVYRINL